MITSSLVRDTQNCAGIVARNEFGKYFRVQDAGENFQTIDDARAGSDEVCTGVYKIDFAAARRLAITKQFDALTFPAGYFER